jgi:hypothetical protein
MAEQERNDKAEQQASDKGNTQETDQISKIKRQLLTPPIAMELMGAYAIVVGTIIAFGALAFYTGHRITQEIIFFTCIPLILAIPAGIVWYLRSTFFPKKTAPNVTPESQRRLDRFKQSLFGKCLLWLGTNPIVRLLNIAFYIYVIADAVRGFQRHPRLSLAMIAGYMAAIFALVIAAVADAFQKQLNRRTLDIWKIMAEHLDVMRHTADILGDTRAIATMSLDFILGTEESHSEAHKTLVAAVKATHETVSELITATHDTLSAIVTAMPDQVVADSPKELAQEPAIDGEKEPPTPEDE